MAEARAGWREPTTRLELRWGSYRSRYLAGVTLIFVGGMLIQLTSTYSLLVLPLGLLAHITGWCILPGIGWRRILGAGVGALTMIVLLNGAPSVAFLAFPVAGWLFIRQRPLLSYVALVIPPFVGFLLAQVFPDYGWGAVVLSIAGLAITAAAWLARSLAAISSRSTGITG